MLFIYLYTTAVSGQGCTNTTAAGFTSYGNGLVTQSQTCILAGYTVPCSGTVVAWEFCYQAGDTDPVTFYPGVWRIIGTSGTNYDLIQSNSVTYDPSIQNSGFNGCQRVNLSTTDQFSAPAGSVVGLYSGIGTQLLHTNTDSSITTYQFSGNQSSVSITSSSTDVNYNIAIRVHLGKYNGNLKYVLHYSG